MKETFGQKTRRSHKRNQRVVMFWCAFVFAFVIAGVWLFRGPYFRMIAAHLPRAPINPGMMRAGRQTAGKKVQMLPRRRWIMKSVRNCKTW